MRHGSARKVLLFVALVALGTMIGIVLTRPASPQPVYLGWFDDHLECDGGDDPASRRHLPNAREIDRALICG